MSKNHIRVAAYARVSNTNLKDSATLEGQSKAIRKYCQEHEHGYVLEDEHIFAEAESAYDLPFRKRPELKKIFEAARRGEIDVVVITEYSRIGRTMEEQMVIIYLLKEYKVSVESITEKFEDNTIEGKIRFIINAIFAEIERDKIVYRTNRGRRNRAENNLTGQGYPTYGYKWVDTKDYDKARYVLNEDVIIVDSNGVKWTEVKVIIFIFDQAKKGASARSIALTLTRMGIPTQRAKAHWSHATIQQILTNRDYTGEAFVFRFAREGEKREGKGRKVVKRPIEEQIRLPQGVVPAIIDIQTFEEVQEQMQRNKQYALRNNKHPKDAGLLRSGLVRCGICNHVMHVKHNAKAYSGREAVNKAAYFCTVNTGVDEPLYHHSVSIGLHILDKRAWEIAVEHILNPQLIRADIEELRKNHPRTHHTEDTQEALADIQKQMDNLYKLTQFAKEHETIEEIGEKINLLETKRKNKRSVLAEAKDEDELNEQIQAALDEFEKWTERVRPDLADPTYEPSYQEMRRAVEILGVKAVVYPVGHEERPKITVGPPRIVQLISESR